MNIKLFVKTPAHIFPLRSYCKGDGGSHIYLELQQFFIKRIACIFFSKQECVYVNQEASDMKHQWKEKKP